MSEKGVPVDDDIDALVEAVRVATAASNDAWLRACSAREATFAADRAYTESQKACNDARRALIQAIEAPLGLTHDRPPVLF